MGNGNNWLWIAAIVAAGIAVLFLVGGPRSPAPVTTTAPHQVAPVSKSALSAPATTAVKPYVNAGPDITMVPCSSVRLTCVGYDPSGGAVTYHWTASGGEGSFSDATALHPIYTAPPVCGCGKDVTLTLTVTNSRGVSASDTMTVHVRPAWYHSLVKQCQPTPSPCWVPPTPPCCSRMYVPAPCSSLHAALTPLIDRALPTAVTAGQPIQLHGRIAGPSCTITRIYWSADKGSFVNITSLDPVYFAPVITHRGGEDATIDLNVIDVNGVRTYDQVRIHINSTQ